MQSGRPKCLSFVHLDVEEGQATKGGRVHYHTDKPTAERRKHMETLETKNRTHMRRGELNDLVSMLRSQHARKHDVVVPAQKMRMLQTGQVEIEDMPLDEGWLNREITQMPGISLQGETRAAITYRTLYQAHRQLHERLHSQTGGKRWWGYYKHMLEEAPHLLAENVNHWLRNDSRNYFVRSFRPEDDEGNGILRAVLSDRYRVMDNLDLLFTLLQTLKREAGGMQVNVKSCDLTDRRMYVCITAPEISIDAPELFQNYRNPETNSRSMKLTAGLVLENSEVGEGSRVIAPRPTAQVCTNALRWDKDELRRKHLGAQMDAGAIQWSEDTKTANMELVRAQTKDAVNTFLSTDYLHDLKDRMLQQGSREIEYPQAAVQNVGSHLSISQDEQEQVLRYFLRSGDETAFGLAQAVTFHAQAVENPERQHELEGSLSSILGKMDEFDVPEEA